MSQLNFQFGKQKSIESSTILQLYNLLILISLGWNSMEFQYHLCYKLQQHGKFSTTGTRKKLNSLAQVDIFRKYFQLLLSISYISYWINTVFRHKPPWLLSIQVYLKDLTKKEGINCQFTITEKLALTYPVLYHTLELFSGSFFWNYHFLNIVLQIAQSHYLLRTFTAHKMFNQPASNNKRKD